MKIKYGKKKKNFLNVFKDDCLRTEEYEAIIENPLSAKPFEEIVYDLNLSKENVSKKAESTYSDVFFIQRGGEIDVLKIIRLEVKNEDKSFTPLPLKKESLLHEIKITKAVNGQKGFVQTKNILLYKGKYPSLLLDAWELFIKKENKNPSKYATEETLFVVFVFQHEGIELELFHFENEEEICFLVLNILEALSESERLCFEHRDMHVSNILVKKKNGKISASLIDFSFSAMKLGGFFIYKDLSSFPFLFTGTESHHSVYRKMKKENKGNWFLELPKTNIFWLKYLLKWLNKKTTKGRTKDFLKKGILLTKTHSSVKEINDFLLNLFLKKIF